MKKASKYILIVITSFLCMIAFTSGLFAADNREIYHVDKKITVKAGETLTISNKNIYRDVIQGELFNVEPGGTLIFDNVIVDGDNGDYDNDYKATINSPLIVSRGTVEMKNSTFKNIVDNFKVGGGSGGIIINNDGIFNVDNVIFDNNECYDNGSVLYQGGATKSAKTTINNSQFINNKTTETTNQFTFGSTITNAAGKMVITNTNMEGNRAGGSTSYRGSGGAIFTQDDLKIDNVIFKNNFAYMGGAMTVTFGNFEITNAIFDGNEAHDVGGAINFAYEENVVKMENVVMMDNYASETGGAIANCPRGGTTLNISNSIAFYDNHAGLEGNTVGLYGIAKEKEWVNIDSYSLSGFKNDVYADVKGDRYQAGVSKELDESSFSYETRGLQVITKGKEEALSNANIIFKNNKALLGGAINNNAKLIVGNDISKALKVIKKWDSSVNTTQIPNEITVALMIGDQEVERVTLSKDNNWEYTFPHLPVGIDYSVKEVDIKGDYYNSIKKEDDGNGNVTFTITNYQKDLSVEKHWEDDNDSAGKRPGSIEVGIYENGKELEKVVLNKGNDWKYTFNNLDLNKDYEVKELNLSDDYLVGYDKKIDEQGNITYLINNYLKADKQIDISVIKKWSDMDNKLNKRPVDVIVGLYADDVLIDSVKLSEANNWQHTFKKLPATSNYYVQELTISSLYEVEYSKDIDEEGNLTFTIINTMKVVDPEKPTNPTSPLPNTGSSLIVMSLGLLFISGISLLGYKKYFNRNK